MRCRNPSCKTDNGKRAKLPKDTLPAVCCDACRDVVIADAIAKSNKAAERARAKARNVKAREEREISIRAYSAGFLDSTSVLLGSDKASDNETQAMACQIADSLTLDVLGKK